MLYKIKSKRKMVKIRYCILKKNLTIFISNLSDLNNKNEFRIESF